MAALGASSFTITIEPFYGQTTFTGRKRVTGTIAFGNGTDTYSTGGIPLPAIGNFGCPVTIQSLAFFGNNARTTDYMVMYDKTNNTLLLYEEEAVAAGGPLLECDTSEAPAARTYDFVVEGW